MLSFLYGNPAKFRRLVSTLISASLLVFLGAGTNQALAQAATASFDVPGVCSPSVTGTSVFLSDTCLQSIGASASTRLSASEGALHAFVSASLLITDFSIDAHATVSWKDQATVSCLFPFAFCSGFRVETRLSLTGSLSAAAPLRDTGPVPGAVGSAFIFSGNSNGEVFGDFGFAFADGDGINSFIPYTRPWVLNYYPDNPVYSISTLEYSLQLDANVTASALAGAFVYANFSDTLSPVSFRVFDINDNDVTDAYAIHWENGTVFSATAVPEPETYAMMLTGLALLGFAAHRRKQKQTAAA